jgi:hypothetical protein
VIEQVLCEHDEAADADKKIENPENGDLPLQSLQ